MARNAVSATHTRARATRVTRPSVTLRCAGASEHRCDPSAAQGLAFAAQVGPPAASDVSAASFAAPRPASMRRRAAAAGAAGEAAGEEEGRAHSGSSSRSSFARSGSGARSAAPAEDPTELVRLRFHVFTLAQSMTHNLVRLGIPACCLAHACQLPPAGARKCRAARAAHGMARRTRAARERSRAAPRLRGRRRFPPKLALWNLF